MNFVLNLILCSGLANSCLPPYEYPELFDDGYSCMIAGNEQSILKITDIGKEEVNKNKFYIKFICVEQTELKKGEPA